MLFAIFYSSLALLSREIDATIKQLIEFHHPLQQRDRPRGLTLSDWHSERLSMTATVHALHAIQTEAELPPMIQNGNPDRIEVSHDFENDAARQIWIEAIAQHAQIES